MGSAARLAVIETAGLTQDPITPEDIAANLALILDVNDPSVTDAARMEM